jgi:hypothetical protein
MKKCTVCEKQFEANRDWQRFCGKACRDKFHAKDQKEMRRIYKEYKLSK